MTAESSLPADEPPHARRLVVAPSVAIDAGAWDAAALDQEPSLGVLVLDGS